MYVSLSEVATAVGCDYNFINNAIRREAIRSRLRPTIPGVPRDFTRDNALEIGFAAAYAKAGIRQSDGDFSSAYSLLHQHKRGLLPQILIYSPDAGRSTFASDSSGTLGYFLSLLAPDGEQARNLVVVNLGEIIRRVDELFAVARDDDSR